MNDKLQENLFKINQNATMRLKDRILENFEDNLVVNRISPDSGIEKMRGDRKGNPCVLVAAGASVAFNRDVMLDAQADGVDIIAANRVARHIPEATHVFNLTTEPMLKNHFMYDRPEGQILVTSIYADPVAVKMWPAGHRLWYNVTSFGTGPEPLQEDIASRIGGEIGSLTSAGIVSAQMVEFALFRGYAPIYCVGYDFAYFEGFTGPGCKRKVSMGDEGVREITANGEKMLSSNRLLTTLALFDQTIKAHIDELHGRIINVGGSKTWGPWIDPNK